MNPDQTDPKGTILSMFFAIFDTYRRTYSDKMEEAKVSDWWEKG